MLWGFLKWIGSGNAKWSLLEAINTWGYVMTVWIPVSLLWKLRAMVNETIGGDGDRWDGRLTWTVKNLITFRLIWIIDEAITT